MFRNILMALLFSILALALQRLGALERIDNLIYDRASGLLFHPASEDIAIVAIDDRSLARLGRWPWSRRIHASLLDRLARAGVRAVGMDIIFAEPEREDPEADKLLAEAMLRNGRVVLPVFPELSGESSGGLKASLPLPQLARAAAALGHDDVAYAIDGVVREAYLEAGIGSQRWDSFPLAILQVGQQARPEESPGQSGPVPTGKWTRGGRFLIPFAGGPGHFRQFSYVDVLRGEAGGAELRGKIVLVGVTAKGLGPGFVTPVSAGAGHMSGVELNANILDALSRGPLIVGLARGWDVLPAAVFVFAPVWGYRLCRPRQALLVLAAGLSAAGAASLALLVSLGYWFSPASLWLALALSYPLWSWRHLDLAARSLVAERKHNLATLNSMGEAVFVVDSASGVVEHLNPAAERMTGFARAEARVRRFGDLMAELCGDQWSAGLPFEWANTGGRLAKPVFLANHSGEAYTVQFSASPIREAHGHGPRILVVLSDISETHQAGRRWTYLATHDALTQLPNRALLQDRLAQAVADGQREAAACFAVCFIDLDGFKKINDGIGHAAGDFVLQEVAKVIKANVRQTDTVARWGGDEFVVLLDHLPHEEAAAALAKKILRAMASPFMYQGKALTVTPSIGISLFPRDGDDVDALLGKADTAMYQVKSQGRNNFRFFMP